MAFELRPGQVTLHRIYDKKKGDNLPYFKGEMLYKGEKIEFVLWEKTTATGNIWYSGKVDNGARRERVEYDRDRPVQDDKDVPF